MKLRNLLIGGALAAVIVAPVMADVNYTQGAGTVIFDFICFTTKHCSGHVPINSAGTEIATSANPLRIDPTGTTTQPVSAASLPLPTGAATSALQSTINSTLGTPFQAGGSIGNTTFAATQATSSNLKAQVDPLTAASWGIGTATQNSASATNGQLSLGQFNTTPTTITTGNMSPLQLDSAGNLLVNIKTGASSGAVAQGSTTAGQTGGLTQAAVTTAAPTYTTAQTSPLSLTTAGELRTFDSQLLAAANGATPAGANIMGKVGIDQTTDGTTNAVHLVAGTAIAGKFGIDQTTPGTTNLVALAANQSVNVAQFGGVSTATGQVAVSVAPVTATNTALVTALRPDSPGIIALGQTTKSASVPVAIASDQVGTAGTAAANVLSVQGIASMTPVVANGTNGYPNGAIAETASATGTTAATTATLATAVGKTTYICGFSMRSVATAAAAGNATVTGTITGTLNFTHGTGATPTVIPNDQRFNPCIPASTTNTSIAVVSPAAGTGGVMSVTAWGFQL